jgi:hypothetical protein
VQRRRGRLACLLTLLLIFGITTAWAHADAVDASSGDTQDLYFGAVTHDAAPAQTTPPQIVFLDEAGGETSSCVAATNQSWISVTSDWLRGPGARLTVALNPLALLPRTGSHDADVTVTCGPPAIRTPHRVRVHLTSRAAEGQPPFGFWELPAGQIRIESDPVVLSGWALDDLGVDRVVISVVDGNAARLGAAPIVIGSARMTFSSRADLVRAYPSVPLHQRATWSYVLDRAALQGLRGTHELSVVAIDVEGHTSSLGTRVFMLEPPRRTLPSWSELEPLRSVLALGALFGVLQLVLRWRVASSESVAHAVEPPDDAAIGVRERVLAAGAVVTFVVLNVSKLTRGLGYDELYSASQVIVGFPFWTTATTVVVFNNHIGYSLVAGLATRLLGPAEWVLRLPAFVCGGAAVYLVWRFGRRVLDPATAVLSAWLLALSPPFGEWAATARGYTLLSLMILISTSSFFRLGRRPSTRTAVLHGLALTVGAYAHLYGLWALLLQYVTFVTIAFRRRETSSPSGPRLLWNSFTWSVAAIALLYAPVALELAGVARARGTASVVAGFPAEILHLFASLPDPWLQWVVAGCAVIGLISLPRTFAWDIACVIVIPIVVMWRVVRPADFYSRFFVYGIPIFCWLLAAGITAIGGRRMWRNSAPVIAHGRRLVAATVLVTVGFFWVAQDRRPLGDGYRELLGSAMADEDRPHYAVGGNAEMFDYYLGKPTEVLRTLSDLETVMREHPRILVAYHDMAWNNPDEQAMADILGRRCSTDGRGVVRLFTCGE